MSTPFQISRRSFLRRCAVTSALTGVPLWFVQRDLEALAQQAAPKLPSANDRINIAQIGCGGMGSGDAQGAASRTNVVAVCDVDESHAKGLATRLAKNGKTPDVYTDFRKMLQRDDIHALINSTPDHWHSLINIAAARAKKDVYGQKPLTLTIDEGHHVVKAIRDNKTVFQTGSQQRSDRRFRLACELVRNGRIGKLHTVHVFVPAGLVGGPFASSAAPASLNWDFWQGQTPAVDYVKERCHANFRWWFEYAAGPVSDWGAHHNDIARWAIGLDGPVAIEGKPLTTPVAGGYNTPSEFEATLTWGNGVKQIVRTTPDDTPYGGVIKKDGQRNGIKFEGTEGWIWVNRGNLDASKEEIYTTPLPESATHLEVSLDHLGNFLECIRTRKDPIAHAEVGHRSASIGHLIAIAIRSGKPLQWDPAKEVFVGENASVGNPYLVREMRKPYDYSFIA